jgi:hypothetical protein
VRGVVFVAKRARTLFFHAAARANHANEIRAAELEIVALAHLDQFVQVLAGHDWSRLRVNDSLNRPGQAMPWPVIRGIVPRETMVSLHRFGIQLIERETHACNQWHFALFPMAVSRRYERFAGKADS